MISSRLYQLEDSLCAEVRNGARLSVLSVNEAPLSVDNTPLTFQGPPTCRLSAAFPTCSEPKWQTDFFETDAFMYHGKCFNGFSFRLWS